MNFEDHFSKFAATYALYRPHYPADLYSYLASQTAGHELAWDCATGSGQAALGLVNHYNQVIATDASAEQLSQAVLHERISYRVEPAEKTSLPSNSVDLITVAIALHWFEFEQFFHEVRRVLKPDGLIAIWTYHGPQINSDLDALIAYLETEVLADYWPERFHYLQEHYQTLPFPFDELTLPAFTIQAEWNMDQMLGFINSWSAVRRYAEERRFHPLKNLWEDFLAAWGGADKSHLIHWRIYLRVGRLKQPTGSMAQGIWQPTERDKPPQEHPGDRNG